MWGWGLWVGRRVMGLGAVRGWGLWGCGYGAGVSAWCWGLWGWGLCVGLGLRVGIEVMGVGVMGI